MQAVFAAIASLLMVLASGWFSLQIKRGKYHPPIVTWAMFVMTVPLLAYATAMHDGLGLSAVQAITDALLTTCVLVVMLRTGNWSFPKNLLEAIVSWCCIGLAILVICSWVVTRDHKDADWKLQVVLALSYLPLVWELATAQRNTQPWAFWITLFVLSALSILPARAVAAIDPDKELGVWYAWRATLCTGLTLIFMGIATLRERKRAAH